MKLVRLTPTQRRSSTTPSHIPAVLCPLRISLSIKLHFLHVILPQKRAPFLLRCYSRIPEEIWSQIEQVCATQAHVDCLFIGLEDVSQIGSFCQDRVQQKLCPKGRELNLYPSQEKNCCLTAEPCGAT